jgi:hypothetical protein
VCLCVHRGECSYVYNYLGLYVFLKKEMISRAYIQIRTIVVGPVRRLCLTGVASPCMQDYNNNRTRLIDDQTSRSRHVHGIDAKNGGELFWRVCCGEQLEMEEESPELNYARLARDGLNLQTRSPLRDHP